MFKVITQLALALLALSALSAQAQYQNPDIDQLGDWMPRYWQRANTTQRCGPYQPWGVSRPCPREYPQGMNCNGVPHGTLCFGHNGGFYPFQCDAPPGQTPGYNNAWFDMYVCP